MKVWAAIFYIIALVAALAGGASGWEAGGITKILFFVFLVLGTLALIFGRTPQEG